jgi:hypothetical protein
MNLHKNIYKNINFQILTLNIYISFQFFLQKINIAVRFSTQSGSSLLATQLKL